MQGFGRIGLIKDEDVAPVHRKKPAQSKAKFDPTEGRDYAADAPQQDPVKVLKEQMEPGSAVRKAEKPVDVPKAKSPAQVAAEKAEEWKRQQIEAENKRKEQKTFISKKKVDAPK